MRHPAGLPGALLTTFVSLVAFFATTVAPGDPRAGHLPTFARPSAAYPMGTDNLGRDMFDQVVHAAATSMTVVVWVLAISGLLGIAAGLVSGYRGGVLDAVLMRLVDMLQAVPRLLLAIVVVALLGSGLEKLIILLGLTSWTGLARVVRAETLSVRRREYVQAARGAGASDVHILLRHVLPNVLPTITVVTSLLASRIILIEASLAFIGLGDPDRVSLGFLLSNAQPYLESAWWMSVFPGGFIVMIVLGFNLLGDALNDVVNPMIAKPVLRRRLASRGLTRGVRPTVATRGPDEP